MSKEHPLEQLKPTQVQVSEGMLGLADTMEQLAKDIREGRVRAASCCWVECGPDMNVNSNWCSMTGRITMLGGLKLLADNISQG